MDASNSSKFRPKSSAGNGPCYTAVMTGSNCCEFSEPIAEPNPSAGVYAHERIMRQATDHHPGAQLATLAQEGAGESDEDVRLRDALKRCSAPTREAAREFRRTGNVKWVPAIIHGLIEHHIEPDARAKLNASDDNVRLAEDLEIDSLTMLEIVFVAEEVLQVSIDNEELRPFKTVGDVKRFVASKLAGASS